MDAETIKEQVSIGDVLFRFGVALPNSKQHVSIKCPFHDDKSPSAWVKRETNRLTCFTCGMNWDQIALAQEFLGGTFPDACTWLCKEFGIDGDRKTLLWRRWERTGKPKARESSGDVAVTFLTFFHAAWWRVLEANPEQETELRALREAVYGTFDERQPVNWYAGALQLLERFG